jgi:hypothetical protein
MKVIAYTIVGLWVSGTALAAALALGFAIRELFRTHVRTGWFVVAVVGGVTACLVNPVINMATFKDAAQAYRAAMIDDANGSGCIGKTTVWLQERYGQPREIRHDKRGSATEHWAYTPGPWYIVHGDHVGFDVVDGVVTSPAFAQAN